MLISQLASLPKFGLTPFQVVSWISLPLASKVVIEITIFDVSNLDQGIKVLHLTHPRPVKWSTVVKVVAEKLFLPLTSYAEWLGKLQTLQKHTADGAVKISALRLLPFFEQVQASAAAGQEAMVGVTLATEKAQRISQTLRDPNLPMIRNTEVDAWVKYWCTAGLLSC
jgi:hypothetical protein